MLSIEERLSLFRELLSSVNPNMTLVELDASFNLLQTNALDHGMWTTYFLYTMKPSETMKFIVSEGHRQDELTAPVLRTNAMGFTWLAEFLLEDGIPSRYVILGPVFLDDFAPKQIETQLLQHGLSFSLIEPFMALVRRMPVLSLSRLYEYGIMLHRCMTGQNCTIRDFQFYDIRRSEEPIESDLQEHAGNYQAEQDILRIIEEGNIHYEKEMLNVRALSGKIDRKIGGSGTILRRAKNTVISFVTLASRAAMRGGLSPEIAYSLCDSYIRQTEEAQSIGLVVGINRTMFDDFVTLVHRKRVSEEAGISPQIADTCNYIILHIAERLDIRMLAARLGYTDYYFSNKFRKETGKTVRDYICEQKVRKAQELLADPAMHISDIAGRLSFDSQNYFGRVFAQQTGMTPTQWRTTHIKNDQKEDNSK